MRPTDFDDVERILAIPTVLTMTVNELRILIVALNALVYFGKAHNEDYIDVEGLELRARLEERYMALTRREFPKSQLEPVDSER